MKPQDYTTDRKQLLHLLNEDELWLNSLILEKGRQYLQDRLGHIPDGVAMYESTSVYWSWFSNQWHLRMREFLETVDQPEGMERTTEWCNYLKLQYMVFTSRFNGLFMNEKTWQEAQAELMQRIIDNQHQKGAECKLNLTLDQCEKTAT